MTITEPATLITDYLLAAFTTVLAWRLLRAARANGSKSQRWWAVAFATTALVGICGGTVHGFQLVLPPLVRDVLWLVTIEGLIVAAFAVVRATLVASPLRNSTQTIASSVAAVVYAAYGLWVAGNPRFVFAIAGYGVALVVLVVFKALAWRTDRRAGRWMLAGVAVSALAAAVQQGGWSLHRHFNHNDLYHVVQAVGIWCLYRGAMADGSEKISRGSA